MSYLSPITCSLTKIRNRYSRSPVQHSLAEEEEIEYDLDAEVAQINSHPEEWTPALFLLKYLLHLP